MIVSLFEQIGYDIPINEYQLILSYKSNIRLMQRLIELDRPMYDTNYKYVELGKLLNRSYLIMNLEIKQAFICYVCYLIKSLICECEINKNENESVIDLIKLITERKFIKIFTVETVFAQININDFYEDFEIDETTFVLDYKKYDIIKTYLILKNIYINNYNKKITDNVIIDVGNLIGISKYLNNNVEFKLQLWLDYLSLDNKKVEKKSNKKVSFVCEN